MSGHEAEGCAGFIAAACVATLLAACGSTAPRQPVSTNKATKSVLAIALAAAFALDERPRTLRSGWEVTHHPEIARRLTGL